VLPSDEEAAEFARMPRRAGRHPAMLAGAMVLASFLIVSMRKDIRFALSSATPLDLGDARALRAAGPRGVEALRDGENRVVRIAGTPDRESALELDTKGSWTFTQLFRLLGTDNRLFVHRLESPVPDDKAEHDVFVGRLVKVSDLPFEEAIRSHFSHHVVSTHFFEPAALVAAVPSAEHGFALKDKAGDTVSLGPNDLLAIDEVKPDVVRLGFPRDRFPAEADVRAAVMAADPGARILAVGASASGTGEPETADKGEPADKAAKLAAEVVFSEGRRDKALQALAERDRRIEMREARTTFKARVGALKLTPDGSAFLLTDGASAAATVPVARVVTVRTLANVVIPPDAYLLVESETPRDHLRDLAVAGVLLVFASVNALGLVQALRP
jgi:hypothetical protein